MLSSEEFLSDSDILVGSGEESTEHDVDTFTLMTVEDLSFGETSGAGFLAIGVAMLLSFGISWLVSLWRKA